MSLNVPDPLGDLIARLASARSNLGHLADNARADGDMQALARLRGKAEGISLALSYAHEYERPTGAPCAWCGGHQDAHPVSLAAGGVQCSRWRPAPLGDAPAT